MRHYAMKQANIDLDAVEKRVCGLFALEAHDLYRHGRQKRFVEARSLLCFWAVRELGVSQRTLAERFSVTEPAISYAVRRGQEIATKGRLESVGEG
jgi:putative transposase